MSEYLFMFQKPDFSEDKQSTCNEFCASSKNSEFLTTLVYSARLKKNK